MDTRNIALLILSIAISSGAFAGTETIQIADIQFAKTLGGAIVDTNGSPIAGVQVFEVSTDQKTVLRSTTTDKDGKWSLTPAPGQKIYSMRFSCDGFHTLTVQIRLNRRKGKDLRFQLYVAT
jgi:hypothetical protein